MILTCLAEKKLLQIVKFFGQNVKVRAIEAHKAALVSIPSALSKTPTSSDVNKTKFLRPRPRPEQQDQDQDQSLQDQD